MLKRKQQIITKIHLVLSTLIVVPISIVYGFFPDVELELLPKTIDEYNFYKAVMGLYLAFTAIWVLGIFKTYYLKVALISNITFMLGLGFGRLLSVGVDGIPTSGFILGTIGELFLGFYGLWVLKTSASQ
ncbi:DUF4345 domain-containing protein [Winogradskyella sp.]|uniref:DUF4345 domain-containing protein n=1 Tax=Winogradskyella sp. TaxID=1883156 RepID=UPI0035C7AB05